MDVIAGYLRVSTREQAVESLSLERQEAAVRAEGATLIFCDVETASRAKDRRPELKRLLDLVSKGKISKVVTFRMDRMIRSVKHLHQIMDVFDEADADFKFLDMPHLDRKTSQGKMMLTFFGMVAELETDNLSARVKGEKQQRRDRELANTITPFGYKVEQDRYCLDHSPFLCCLTDRPERLGEEVPGRTIYELCREAIELFITLRSSRVALHRLFEKYGVQRVQGNRGGNTKTFSWTPPGFTGWLLNPVLQGHTVYLERITTSKRTQAINPDGPTIIRGTHLDQRLLSDEEVATIQQILDTNRRIGGSGFNPSLDSPQIFKEFAYLNGLVYCAECGATCTPKTSQGRKYQYFACRYAGAGCNNKGSVKKGDIEKDLIQYLVAVAQKMHEEARDASHSYFNTVSLYLTVSGADEAELHSFAKTTSPKYEHWKAGENWQPEPSTWLDQLKEQRRMLNGIPGAHFSIEEAKQKLDKAIKEEEERQVSIIQKDAAEIIFNGDNLAFWQGLTNDEKVAIFDKIVQKIFVRGRQVERIYLKMERNQQDAVDERDQHL